MSAPFSALALSAAISKCPWKISEMHCSPRILLRFWIYSAVSICTVNKMCFTVLGQTVRLFTLESHAGNLAPCRVEIRQHIFQLWQTVLTPLLKPQSAWSSV